MDTFTESFWLVRRKQREVYEDGLRAVSSNILGDNGIARYSDRVSLMID